jgi:hypothetical protein
VYRLLRILLPCLLALAGCTAAAGGGVPAYPAGDPERPAAGTVDTAPRPALQVGAVRATPLHWDLDARDIARIDDDVERTAVRFVDGLVGEDRRRMLRQFGAPVLFSPRTTGPSRVDYLRADERGTEAHDAYLDQVGISMLRRPLRDALRELPIAKDVEEVFEEFKEDQRALDPIAEAAGARSADWGRMTMRVRKADLADGVELGYEFEGLRVRSSLAQLRCRLDLALWENATARLGWSQAYDSGDHSLRLEFAWAVDRDTSVHLLTGDRMEFFDRPAQWSQDRSPQDGSPGLVFYVERIF